jgi:hypothetical protein
MPIISGLAEEACGCQLPGSGREGVLENDLNAQEI